MSATDIPAEAIEVVLTVVREALEAEIHHAEDNGHSMVVGFQQVTVVRADYIRAAVDGADRRLRTAR